MKTLIRYATTTDFQTLLSIDAACFPPEIAYDHWEFQDMMSSPGAETIVLEEDGKIRGFLLMDVDRRRKTATLVTLDVLSESRRKGHASKLLARSEQILAGYGVAAYKLQVDTNNEAALSFYRKNGFEMQRLLRRYYPGGGDAWEMIKRFPTIADGSPQALPGEHESRR
jgi:[ribosomal protein S18]-alanine N-acetyltransferase